MIVRVDSACQTISSEASAIITRIPPIKLRTQRTTHAEMTAMLDIRVDRALDVDTYTGNQEMDASESTYLREGEPSTRNATITVFQMVMNTLCSNAENGKMKEHNTILERIWLSLLKHWSRI